MLVALLVVIVGVIAYIDAAKPKHLSPSSAPDIALPSPSVVPSGAPGAQTATSASATVQKTPVAQNRAAIQAKEAAEYSRGKELVGIAGYINSGPFTLSDYVAKGNVVLVDFWTYSCINCQRTIPYLNAWYQKYKNQGLVIVGVFSPEFDFEKDYNNVSAAVKKFGIQYPVALDNDMQTWDAYSNEYWPAEYLINNDGFIVHNDIGEGNYAETEQAIQAALKARDAELGLPDTVPTGLVSPSGAVAMDSSLVLSPETYFGSNRNEYLSNGTHAAVGSQTLTLPNQSKMVGNALYLDGVWNFESEYAESTSPTAKIVFSYNAKNVYMVANSANGVYAKVLIDGKPIDSSVAGSDVSSSGTVFIKDDRLYNLVSGLSYGPHTIELDVEGSGLNAYTFTFG